MKKNLVKENLRQANKLLIEFINNDENIEKISQAADIMTKSINKGGKIIACGNGGSMSDAMHFAAELTGRFHKSRNPLPAVAISDPSHITCIGNDYGFDYIFSRYVETLGKKEDILLAISTSGNSLNVLNAAKSAKNKGIDVIGLTADNGGKLANLCNLEIRVPKTDYSDRAQEIHIKVIHSLVECIESNIL